MGVKTLWTILSGAGEMTDLRELQGKRVAVDLAGWIVQSNQCRAMTSKVNKPHLRNVFFRAAALQALNIHPIFVFDGDAPALKQQTLQHRRVAEQQQTGSSQSQSQSQSTDPVKLSRNRLKMVMGECRALLQAMGFECVASVGEAEAMCAQLNAEGLVDAVITEDSDAFCYGAEVILRNFSISASGPSVEMYTASRLDELLGLTRDRIVFVAILLGCDFFPTGIPGIGKELVHQLFSLWPKRWNTINALKIWSNQGFPYEDKKGKNSNIHSCSVCLNESNGIHCSDCRNWMKNVSGRDCHCLSLVSTEIFKIENSIKKKCAAVDSNWWETEFQQVLNEFQCTQKTPNLKKIGETAPRPSFDTCVELMVRKLAWTEEYAVEKMLPILTRWQVKTVKDGLKGPIGSEVIRPEQITKKRVRDGNPCFDISWTSMDQSSKFVPKTFESCEPSAYVRLAYPQLVADFEEALSAKAKPKKTKVAGNRKPKAVAATASATEPQPTITNFFTQNKACTVPSKKDQSEKTKLPTQVEPVKTKQSKIEQTQNFQKNLDLVPKKNIFASSVPKKCDSVPPSPILMHREVLKLRGEISVLNDMSVDATNDSIASNLSMIIDNFISRKPDSKENIVPNISAPVSTSTPQCHKIRESIQNKVFKKLEPSKNSGNQVTKKPLSSSKNLGPIKQSLATNPFSKNPSSKNVFKFKTVGKPNIETDISMVALDESLPKLDIPRSAPQANDIENYLSKTFAPQKNVDKDSSMLSLNGTLEDSFDRMCK